MMDANSHSFLQAEDGSHTLLSVQLQMLVQLQFRALLRRQAHALIEQELARTPKKSDGANPGLLVERKTILIADNQSSCRAIAREILANLGFHAYSSAADSRYWPLNVRCDLLLLDVPVWNVGQNRRVEQAKERSERLIVATPLPEGPALAALRAAGADALVRKPYDPRELARSVEEVLRLGERHEKNTGQARR